MRCRVAEFGFKEVINVCDGYRLGFVYDVAVNVTNGQVLAIIVPGRCRLLGLFRREDDYVIPWECIRKIGEDIILVEVAGPYRREKRPRFGRGPFF